MRSTLILIFACVATFTTSSAQEVALVPYAGIPINSELPHSDLYGLVDVHGGPGLKLLTTKTVNLGNRVGSLLFVEYQRGDTAPPSKVICAYRRVTAKRYKLLVPEIDLFY